MAPVVKVRELRKSYGDTVAVQDVSPIVQRGEIFGIIGPNRAGRPLPRLHGPSCGGIAAW
jgi:ABC-type branched-subunit amino acid transport system ATPase component